MKRILSGVLLGLSIAAVSSFGQPQLEKARELIKQNNSTEAITLLQTYIQSSQKDEKAWFLLAQAFRQSGKLDDAENAAKRVIQLDDQMMEAYTLQAEVQFEKKNYQDAYATAKAGIAETRKNQPRYPPLLVILGRTLIQLDSADVALIAASEAKELDPKNIAAYEVIGDAYVKQKVMPMAINSYENALEIDSLQPNILYKLANTHIKERQYPEAARVYVKILTLDPQNDAARLELADLYFRAAKPKNIVSLWQRCAATLQDYFKKEKNPPKELQAKYLEALLGSRQYVEAAEMGRKFLKSVPNSPLAYRAIANGLYNEKKYQAAIDNFKKIDTLEFDDYKLLGLAYRQLKQDTVAARMWTEGLKDTSIATSTRLNFLGEIGRIYFSREMFEKAAEIYGIRIEVDSNEVSSYVNLAQSLSYLKKNEKAISVLKTALTFNKNYPPIYVTLGFCYYQMGEFEAGKKEFETAIKIIDTAEWKYRGDLADANRMIALSVMLRKESSEEASFAKWQEAITFLKKSLKYKEDFDQTHLNLGKCYQNLNSLDILNEKGPWKAEAIKAYKRTLQLNPKNQEAIKALKDLTP